MLLVEIGQNIVLTDYGKALGRILPIEEDLQNQIEALRSAGLVEWNGKILIPINPPVVNRSSTLASDLGVEMREQPL